MGYNLARLAKGKRRPFRAIAPLTSQEYEFYRIYLRNITAWRNAAAALMAVYAGAVASGSVDQLIASQDAEADNIAAETAALYLAFQAFFMSMERWHRQRWIANVKASAGIDVEMLIEKPLAVATGGRVAAQRGSGIVAAARQAASGTAMGTVLRTGLGITGPVTVMRPLTGIDAVIGNAVAENVTLIRSVSEETRARMSNILITGVRTGKSPTAVARELNAGLGISRKRALRIATDQVEKVNATITEYRAKEAGSKRFRWLHRYRGPNPRMHHVARNGKIYRWDDAPADLPGILINCHCLAQPVFDDE